MNTIKIKHGTNAPTNGTLQPYELGYVTSTGTLVIGDADKNTKALNYLQLDENGYIPILKRAEKLVFQSTDDYPKVKLTSTQNAGEVDYCAVSSNGRAYILEWPVLVSGKYCERYNFPIPSDSLTENKIYTVLTTKGGTFAGDFTFSNKLTANGAIIVGDSSYGKKDPNTAGTNGAALSGTVGQLYFVVTG